MNDHRSLSHWLRLLFGFEQRVSRRLYLLSGLSLALVKYFGDLAIVWALEDRVWRITDYLSPFGWTTRQQLETEATSWLLVLWMLPFVWIGISMSARRALDSGMSAVLGLLFAIPIVNYFLIVLLCLARPEVRPPLLDRDLPQERLFSSRWFLAVGAGTASLLPILVIALAEPSYGSLLFVGAPLAQGFVTAWIYGYRRRRSFGASVGAGASSVLVAGILLLVGGIEGAICLLMALPMAGVLAAVGAALAHTTTRAAALRRRHLVVLLALTPALIAVSPPPPSPLREVSTSVVIHAPPEIVWNHVTSFTALPEPTDWFLRLGIAYPKRAHYTGHGEGAVRYCEFSTGPFVEPITHWDAPHRLAFEVSSQPPTLEEWSPWADLQPPHVTGTLHSRRGEFRLIELPDGGTRLEGSTWYELEMAPQIYWTLWSDELIHRIHRRVLDHIRRQAEAAFQRAGHPSTTRASRRTS